MSKSSFDKLPNGMYATIYECRAFKMGQDFERARIREGAADRVHEAHMEWATAGVSMDGYYDMIVDAVLGVKEASHE